VIVAEADLELSTALVAVRLIVCSVVTWLGNVETRAADGSYASWVYRPVNRCVGRIAYCGSELLELSFKHVTLDGVRLIATAGIKVTWPLVVSMCFQES